MDRDAYSAFATLDPNSGGQTSVVEQLLLGASFLLPSSASLTHPACAQSTTSPTSSLRA